MIVQDTPYNTGHGKSYPFFSLTSCSFFSQQAHLSPVCSKTVLHPSSALFSPVWGLNLIPALLLGRAITEEHQRHSGLYKGRLVDTLYKRWEWAPESWTRSWSTSALHMSVHGNFNNLGGNILESRITFKDLKVAGNWRSIGGKRHLILAQLSDSFMDVCYYSLW